MAKNDDENKKVTVIIAPIRVAEQEDGSLSISFACNRGPFCHDPYCRYSKMSRELSTS
jgi:hypothetical protein